MDGVKLMFEDDMLDYVVDKALEFKLGARGLRGLMEAVMIDIMYDRPQDGEFVVTKQYAEERLDKSQLHRLKNAI